MYARLIEAVSCQTNPVANNEAIFSLLPASSISLPWGKIVAPLYKRLFCLPVLCLDGRRIAPADLEFLADQDLKYLAEVFRQLEVCVCFAPSHFLAGFVAAGMPMTILSPVSLRQHLRQSGRATSSTLTPSLLKFLLSDGCSFDELIGLRVLPMVSGNVEIVRGHPKAGDEASCGARPVFLHSTTTYSVLRFAADSVISKVCCDDKWLASRLAEDDVAKATNIQNESWPLLAKLVATFLPAAWIQGAMWTCPSCTYLNKFEASTPHKCEMCAVEPAGGANACIARCNPVAGWQREAIGDCVGADWVKLLWQYILDQRPSGGSNFKELMSALGNIACIPGQFVLKYFCYYQLPLGPVSASASSLQHDTEWHSTLRYFSSVVCRYRWQLVLSQ